MAPLSYSSMSTYLECPLRYKFRYIDKMKEGPKFYFSFGHSIHSTLEYMHSGVRPPTIDSLLLHFRDHWEDAGYRDEDERQKYYDYGMTLVQDYYRHNVKNFRPSVAVEYSFNTEINGIKVRGFIDRIDRLKTGQMELLDYKTGKAIYSKKRVAEDTQLTFYQAAIEESTDYEVGRLTIYHMRTLTPVSSGRRPASEVEKLGERLAFVRDSIDAGKFEPKRHRFCPCDFAEYCPFFKDKFTKEHPREDIEEIVERYAILREQEAVAGEEIAVLESIISGYCQDKDVRRIFSRDRVISMEPEWRTDRDSVTHVKSVLEEAGLWSDVESFDSSKLDELIKNEKVTPDVQRKLEKVIEKTGKVKLDKSSDDDAPEEM